MSCCPQEGAGGGHDAGYGAVFTSREARAAAARFRRRGLRRPARNLVEAVISAQASAGIAPGSLIEVGGGAGEIGLTFLERGAANRVVNVELSDGWEQAARELLGERGRQDQVERLLGDFVERAEGLAEADLVVLHRVVCCYPDWRGMLGAATSRASRLVALTVPVDRWWTRAAIGVGNRVMRWRGQGFRAHVHSPEAMIDLLSSAGLAVTHDKSGWQWRTMVATRR